MKHFRTILSAVCILTLLLSLNAGALASSSDELEDLYLNTGSAYSSAASRQIDLHPAFDEDETDYTVLVPYSSSLSALNLRLYLTDDDTELSIEDEDISLSDDYYDYAVDLPAAGYSKTVDFTAAGTDYTLTVLYAAKSADDTAELSDLAVRSKVSTSSSYELTLSPSFDEDEDSYTLEDAGDYSKLYLYPEADDDMTVFVEDQLVTGSYWSFDPDDCSEVTVTVYAEDLETYATYTVYMDGSGTACNLTSLYLYTGSSSGSLSLSPSFSSTKYDYIAQVPGSVSSVYLIPAYSGSPTVRISVNFGSYSTFSSYAAYSLSYGLNVIDLAVGSTHYYINIYRPADTASIAVSSQSISVNGGSARQIAAYNINGNNFVKLRDLASLLSGTTKQFSVSYSAETNSVLLISGAAYTSVGGEMTVPGAYTSAVVTAQRLYLNGSAISPMAYNIDGSNYILLRDLAALFNVGITFSGSTAYLYSARSYGYSTSSALASSSSDADFSDIDMKLLSGGGDTYLSASKFDPDDDSYSVGVDDGDDTLCLYVYYDSSDFDVTVEYDGDDDLVTESSYSSSGGCQRFYIDIEDDVYDDDLGDIEVTVEDGSGSEETYTFSLYLSASASSSDGDFSDVDMKLLSGGGDTCVSASEFDPDEDTYWAEVSEDETYLYLYVYYDNDEYSVGVEYDGDDDLVSSNSYVSSSGYQRFLIDIEDDVDSGDLSDIDVTVESSSGDEALYTFILSLA